MRKNILLAIFMAVAFHCNVWSATEIEKHWNCNPYLYPNTMTVVGVVEIDRVEQGNTSFEVGAFCGTECRGSEMLRYFSQVNRYLVFLTVYGEDNDTITFKLYDHGLEEEVDVGTESMTFEINAMHGLPTAPYELNFLPYYTVTVAVNPTASGTVTGGGRYLSYETVTLSATSNTGYTFLNWTRDGEVVGTESTYQFEIVGDCLLVANFEAIMHHISVSANIDAGGTVSGGGDYQEGTYATVSAVPNTGFDFVRWTENGASVSTNANYMFAVWNPRDLVAEFEMQVTDTTAYTCDAFEWHGHSYTTNGIYYDTLTSYLGIDSIVALHLTVYPSYHYEYTETECGNYFWEDSLYTESGDYTREFQSIYGCDSIRTLHLTILPIRPLGNFTYMSPANNYIDRYTDMDFYWDAIPNANCYDFYFWQGDGSRPDTPTLSNTTSHSYHVNGLTHGSTYQWCVVAKNECEENESATRTFTCQLNPAMSVVPNGWYDFGEVEIGQTRTRTISVSGTALTEDISYGFLDNAWGQDADFFTITSSNWNPTSGGMLHVTFAPEATQLYYNAGIRIASGAFVDTLYFSGSVANRYVFTTNVDGDVFSANDEILITGHVEDILGNPVSDLGVSIYLMVMGTRTTGTAVSDANGNYSTTYTPRYSESGFYQVGSCAYGTYSNEVHDSFDIPGMSRVSNNFIIWEPYQDETLTGTVEIRNRSRIPISNINVNTISLPNGCSVSFTGVTSLGPLETGTLNYVVTGSQVTTGNNYYDEALFQVTADNGLTMNMTCYYHCRERRGALAVYPPSIATTMKRYNQKALSFQITNNGNGETGPITIGLPDVEWMSLLGSNTLESLPVGDSCAFSVLLAPDENVSLNQYSGSIAVNCDNGNGISIPYLIEATSDSTGVLRVDVTDDNTYNGNGDHLAGANVYVKGYYSLEMVAQGVTDENGLFIVENLPEGYYYLTIHAREHSNYEEGIILIEGGKTNHQNIYLQYQAISYSWVVVPTEIEDVYEFELVAEIHTNVPAPVVTVDCPSKIDTLAYGDTIQFNLTVTNHGLIDAYETHLTMPTEFPEYDFVPMIDFIDTLHAKTSVVIPCIVTRTQRRTSLNDYHCHLGSGRTISGYYCNQERKWVEFTFTIGFRVYCNYTGPDNPIVNFPTPTTPSVPPVTPVLPPPSVTGGGGWFGGSGGSGSGGSVAPSSGVDNVTTTSQDCTPCWQMFDLPLNRIMLSPELQELMRQSRSCASALGNSACPVETDSIATEWPMWTQTGDLSKIDPELQELMRDSRDGNETFRVIVEMKEQYDDPNLERGTAMMTRAERRDYVVNELKRFSEGSQSEITRHLDALATRGGVRVLHHFWIFNGVCCEATASCIDDLSLRNDVRYISVDKEIELIEPIESGNRFNDVPPIAGAQWHVRHVGAEAVWNNLGYKGRGVVVAIIDTGVNYNHVAIRNKMWDGGGLYSNHGWDFYNNDDDPIDDHGHGSHVAGIVSGNGVLYQSGIAPEATIMALKVLGTHGGSEEAVCRAVEFAVEHGADVINLSLGISGSGGIALYRDTFNDVMKAGVVATVSAGNEGTNQSIYPVPFNVGAPGNCPPPWNPNDSNDPDKATAVICVGNTTKLDKKRSTSSIGPVTWNDFLYDPSNPMSGLIRPDVSAPGTDIWSIKLDPNYDPNSYGNTNYYQIMSGTSMAAPCVAGVIALMLEANPNLTPAQIDEILETTAVACKGQILDDEGQILKDNNCGAGRVNAYAAVQAAAALNGNMPEMCHISVTSYPYGCFEVEGTDTYQVGAECTIKALNESYFSHWEKNGARIPNAGSEYTFNVTGDEQYVAIFEEVCKHISVIKSPESYCASIEGVGDYILNEPCTLIASPSSAFLHWEKNGVIIPNAGPEYTFNVTGDEQYVAVFDESIGCKKIILQSNYVGACNPYGTGIGTGIFHYFVGEECTLSIKPNDGYEFLNITKNGIDISTDPNYTFNTSEDTTFVSFAVTEDATYVANFKRNCTITTVVFPEAAGNVTGGGSYWSGESCTVTAVPNPGYVFRGWYTGTIPFFIYSMGMIPFSPQNECTFTVESDIELMAWFTPISQNGQGFPTLYDWESEAALYQTVLDAINSCMLCNRDVSWEENLAGQLGQCRNFYQAILNVYTNLFQEAEWMEEQNIAQFLENFYAFVDPIDQTVSPQALQQLIELSELTSANASTIQSFVERWNRSVQYWNEGIYTLADLPEGYDPNFVQKDSTMLQPAEAACEYAIANGFNNFADMYYSTRSDCSDLFLEHQNDVCAKISVSFKQTMTMTREAFEGTLKIFNGHTTDPMQDINVDIVIKDADGVDRTDLFQVNVTSLSDITGVDGTGTLAAQTEGIAQFMMIPTIEAAPDTTKVYYFGGSFSFLDPFSGNEMTYELFPVQLKVNPGPNLHVDYFISRHIISDDPLTDTIEATEPAELAMMISNVGAGDANNVYLESSQPQIIENQNGLLISFDMVGAAMNGEMRPLGLIDIPFGTIESHTAGIAEWYFTSTLMARVVHSTPHVIHRDSYGNPKLSVVTELNSHDLIKAIRAYGSLEDGINDFFVNETADFYHTPDMIYFSHGGTADVRKINVATTEGELSEENDVILLHVTPIAVGWNYACLDDPAQGLREIVSCTRDDGQEIPLSNVWISHVTMFDEGAPVHENKLHIVDTLAVNQMTTYTLVYGDVLENNTVTQTMSLAQGWNWWSTYIDLDDDGLERLETALNDKGVIIKSHNNGYVMYENGSWYGNLQPLENQYMYMILTNNHLQLSMTGPRVTASQVDLEMFAGWNWIGYPLSITQSINDALTNLAPSDGDILKSMSNFSIYYDGAWFGSLLYMNPGLGYLYHAAQPHTFNYQANRACADVEQAADYHWDVNIHEYPYNMGIIAVLELDDEELRSEDYEVAAFCDGKSLGTIRPLYHASLDRYYALLPVSGEEGMEVSFRLYHAESGEEYRGAERYLFSIDAVYGNLNAPNVLHFYRTNGWHKVPNALTLYPNPAKSGGEVRLELDDESAMVRAEIYNVLDVLVAEQDVKNGCFRLNNSIVPGTYILRVYDSFDNVYHGKLIVE